MIAAVQAALDDHGIADTVAEVGQFEPRGTTGSIFAGGIVGGELGSTFGSVGDAVGTAAGFLGGAAANAQSRGLPPHMLVGASDTTIYGFAMRSRRKEPHELVFQVPRAGLAVKVHGRVNVRTLELVDTATGSAIELEGSRLPITHSHDFIRYVAGDEAASAADAEAEKNA